MVLADRVQELTSTTGTGTLTLTGAVSGFQSFGAIGDGNTTYYTIVSGTSWEVGIGTYTLAGTTLSRDTILSSSAGGTAISVAAGASVFCDYPAGKAVTTTDSIQLVGDATSTQNIATAATTGALNIGGAGAASGQITIGRGTTAGAQTVQIGGTGNIITVGAASGIQPITIGRSGTALAVVNINTGSASGKTTNIATNASSGTNTVTIGSTGAGSNVINVATGTNAQTVNISTGATTGAQTINIANGVSTSSKAIDIGGGSAPSSSISIGNTANTSITIGTSGGTTTTTINGPVIPTDLTASQAVFTNASKNLVSVATTGTGLAVLATSPALITPDLGTPSAGVVTNLTGTASININGTVGATTANTGAFTYISTSSSTSTTPTLSFNASNSPYAAGATISGSYLQHMLQNKSATAGASTNYVLSNDSGTDSTFYGEFGMNSSVFSASTPTDYFSINNGVYFSAHDGDVSVGSGNGFKTYLAWGTAGQSAHVINASGAIGLNTNLGTTPALSGTTNFGTAGQVLVSAGNAATAAWSSTPTLTGTNFTGIPNGGLTNSAITFGATSQALGSTVSALNAVSVGATTASTGRFTGVTVTAGTASVAPIQLTSGTNLTSATAGAIEYDGVNFYATTDTTNGRNVVSEYQQFYLSAGVTAFGPASGDFFGATSSASLAATTSYDIECYCYFLKTTAGTAQWIPTFSTALTVGHCYLEYTPVTGFTTTVITGAMVTAEATQQTTTVLTTTATASLTTAVSHIAKLKIRVLTNTACNFRLKFVGSAGTITPQAGSWYTVRKVASNAGNFVA
jgi:hypothetical protein